MKTFLSAIALAATATAATAGGHAMPMIMAGDQSAADGFVSAEKVVTNENGWLVVHSTDANLAPGPVVGHAPLRKGENNDVVALLTQPVEPGEMLMLMVHAEAGGTRPGIFEYTLGASEDGPIRIDGELVVWIVTAQ